MHRLGSGSPLSRILRRCVASAVRCPAYAPVSPPGGQVCVPCGTKSALATDVSAGRGSVVVPDRRLPAGRSVRKTVSQPAGVGLMDLTSIATLAIRKTRAGPTLVDDDSQLPTAGQCRERSQLTRVETRSRYRDHLTRVLGERDVDDAGVVAESALDALTEWRNIENLSCAAVPGHPQLPSSDLHDFGFACGCTRAPHLASVIRLSSAALLISALQNSRRGSSGHRARHRGRIGLEPQLPHIGGGEFYPGSTRCQPPLLRLRRSGKLARAHSRRLTILSRIVVYGSSWPLPTKRSLRAP